MGADSQKFRATAIVLACGESAWVRPILPLCMFGMADLATSMLHWFSASPVRA
jgi:hypothetical protein